MEDLIRVIYVSAASPDISEHDTVKFLNEARKANRKNDISGMMLYIDRCFLLSPKAKRSGSTLLPARFSPTNGRCA